MGHRLEDRRWAARPVVASLVRAALLVGPVGASVLASWAVQRALPPVDGVAELVLRLLLLLAVSTIVLVGTDRLGRRVIPLAALLELTMLFPDHAPSRLQVARDAIRRRPIEEQLARLRAVGADPSEAAREILSLVAALSLHDRPTRGHAERVRMYTDLVAQEMGVPARDRDLLRWAALLHDIGKLRVPAELLNKPDKPTEAEWAVLHQHPRHGAEIASALLPWLGEWGDVIAQHHERYDGTGYPAGLSGRDICLGARIVAVADAYDVMTAARAYRRPVSRAAAHRELVKWSGRQFDPVVVRAMVGLSAPRLRRAQGLVAWLADLPIIASGTVPATTLARVVGASALAGGAATGLAVPGGVNATPAEASSISSVDAPAGSAADATHQPGGVAAGQRAERSGRGPASTVLRPESAAPTPHASTAAHAPTKTPTAAPDPNPATPPPAAPSPHPTTPGTTHRPARPGTARRPTTTPTPAARPTGKPGAKTPKPTPSPRSSDAPTPDATDDRRPTSRPTPSASPSTGAPARPTPTANGRTAPSGQATRYATPTPTISGAAGPGDAARGAADTSDSTSGPGSSGAHRADRG